MEDAKSSAIFGIRTNKARNRAWFLASALVNDSGSEGGVGILRVVVPDILIRAYSDAPDDGESEFSEPTQKSVEATKTTSNKKMKKHILTLLALSSAAAFAADEATTTTTTTTTTVGNGTITEYTPGTTFIVKETSGPVTYRYGKTVTYVTKSGKTLSEADVKTRIKVGVPVHVHYVKDGEARVISRIELDED